MEIKISEEKMQQEFAALTAIDSVSYEERRMADQMRGMLTELGFAVEEDNAADRLRKERPHGEESGQGDAAGNLYGFLKGDLPGDPILLSAHLDTVRPGYGKKALFREDGVITSDGNTVLGADDVAGLLEILEGIRAVRAAGIPHRDIEVLFFVAEEMHCRGSSVFEYDRIRSREAYVLDLSGPVGTAAVQAPTILTFEASVIGKAAHAGFRPEDGVHAIAVMADAITRIPHGRLYAGKEEETMINIGSITGGGATNIVPALCTCTGEIRSCVHEQAVQMMEQVKNEFEETAAWYFASAEVKSTVRIRSYRTEENSPAVRHFLRACEALGFPGDRIRTFGGSDNNNLAQHGIQGLVLSCGMTDMHSTRESIRTEDLVNGARLVAELITDAPS